MIPARSVKLCTDQGQLAFWFLAPYGADYVWMKSNKSRGYYATDGANFLQGTQLN